MKHSTLAFLLILFVVGVLCWRESRHGSLMGLERQAARWTAQAAGLETADGSGHLPTLVFQGGLAGGELQALDIGLFSRAAQRLGARVAAVVTYDFPSSEIRLLVPEGEEVPRHLAGTLLIERSARAGLEPLTLPEVEAANWKLEQYRGSFSAFPLDRGWQGGFLNLPARVGAAGSISLLAELDGTIVASFALAAHLAGTTSAHAATVRSFGEEGLQLGHWLLPMKADGSLPLESSLLGGLRRVDMDDVLLEVERLERGGPVNDELRSLFADRTVLFGTLAGGNLRLEGGRQFSLVEFQGLALASLQAALIPLPPPWWADAGGLVFGLLAAWTARRSGEGRRWAAFLAWAAGWMLLVLGVAGDWHLVLPIVYPTLLILLAWPLSFLFPAPRGLKGKIGENGEINQTQAPLPSSAGTPLH